MSLPHTYRFKIENKTGVTVDSGFLFINARRYLFNNNGQLNYETTGAQVYTNGGDITNDSFLAGVIMTNQQTGWIGGSFLFAGRPNSAHAGNVNVYLERSTDVGSSFDVDGLGTLVATIPFSHATDAVSRGLSFDL